VLLVQAIDEFFNGYFSTHERSAKTRIAYRSDLDQMAAHAGKDFADLLERVVHRKLGSRLAPAELFACFDATKNGCSKSLLLLLGQEGCA